jgi:hypothetical protein
MRSRRILAFLCATAAAACGGGGDGGTEPPPPPAEAEVASVTVTGPAGEGVPGDEFQLVATARDGSGEELPDQAITWTTSDQAIASVSPSGLATAVAPGSVTLTATSEGKSGGFSLMVREGGRILPGGGSLIALGGSVTLQVPAGAVAAPVSITVAPAPVATTDPSLVPGTGYVLGPAGTAFAAPAELTLRYAGNVGPSGVPESEYRLHQEVGGALQSLGGDADTDAGTVTAPMTTLGAFAVARGPSETPCTGGEHRQFDFWVGAWNVTTPGQTSPPTPSDITLEEGGCAVFENFGNGAGRSINVYSPADGRWHQTFVFGSGQRLLLIGGLEGEAMVLTNPKLVGPPGSFERWTWTRLSEGRVRQHQEFSRDGGATVQTGFDGTYVPR